MKKISIMKKRFLIIVCILYSSVTFAYAELMGTNDSTILNVIADKNIEIFYNKRKIPRKKQTAKAVCFFQLNPSFRTG